MELEEGAFPGYKVLVAVKGPIIFRRSYGSDTPTKPIQRKSPTMMYDIASITKITIYYDGDVS